MRAKILNLETLEKYNAYKRIAQFNIDVINNKLYINDLEIIDKGFPNISNRNIEILKERILYKTSYTALGIKYNLTKQRVKQICDHTIELIKLRYFYILIRR